MINETQLFLTDAEIRELTGKTRAPAQVKVLNKMRYNFVVRPDGKVKVLRSFVEEKLGVKTRQVKQSEPNWGAINA